MKSAHVLRKLTDVGLRTTKVITRCYQLIRAYLLYLYEEAHEAKTKAIQELIRGEDRTNENANEVLREKLRELNESPEMNTQATFPEITENFIKMAFQVITKYGNTTRIGKVDSKNKLILNKLTSFYGKYKDRMGFDEDVDGKHLSQILAYSATTILTSIENNIKTEFCKHLMHLINVKMKPYFEKIEASELPKKLPLKEARKQLKKIKDDIMNGTKNSNSSFHTFVDQISKEFLPDRAPKVSLLLDLNNNPQRYLVWMLKINRNLEVMGRKQLQFFPLRTQHIIKYFPLDTASIIKILIPEGRREYECNVTERKDEIWRKFFDMDNTVFKSASREFSYMIYTDCHAVSILFKKPNTPKKYQKAPSNGTQTNAPSTTEAPENEKQVEKKPYVNSNSKTAQRIRQETNKGLTAEEKAKKQAERQLLKSERETYLASLNKKQREREIERATRARQDPFPYIDDLTNAQLNELKERNLVFIDPGKIRLLTMVGKYKDAPVDAPIDAPIDALPMDSKRRRLKRAKRLKDTFLTYSNRQRLKETKRLEYAAKMKRYKDVNGITEIEHQLSDYNSHSCYLYTFLLYVKKKTEIGHILFDKYTAKIFRQLNWYAYINKQRSEQRLVDNIKRTYGTDAVLMYGDWSVPKQMKHMISTPMIGLKRRLRKDFYIVNIDEYNTSKLNYKTEEETKNLYLLPAKPKKEPLKSCLQTTETTNEPPQVLRNSKFETKLLRKPHEKQDSKGRILYKLHSVLTYKMDNTRLGCINRDRNGAFNMRKVANYWLYRKRRPKNYARSQKAPLPSLKNK